MGISTSWLHLTWMLVHILIFQFSLRTTAIRKDIGFRVVRQCNTTVQGRYFLSDDNGTYASVFYYCAGRCRHSSESVVHENSYLNDFHHCFLLPSNSSAGINSMLPEARLNGINVFVGSKQKYMTCKGACLASVGTDQPAEFVHDAPKHLNPGSCLYTQAQCTLSCDGANQTYKETMPLCIV